MNFTNIDFHSGRKKKTILRKSMGVTLSTGGELEIPKWSFIYTQCELTINKQTNKQRLDIKLTKQLYREQDKTRECGRGQ